MQRTVLSLAASGAVLATAAPASAQTYTICGAAEIPNPANPYYCIPDPDDTGDPVPRSPRVTLGVAPKRDRSAPIRFRVRGRVVRPSGVGRAGGCEGLVRVSVRRGRRVIATRTARVQGSCAYATKVRVRGRRLGARGRLKVRARFGGNTRLRAKASPTVTVRYAR